MVVSPGEMPTSTVAECDPQTTVTTAGEDPKTVTSDFRALVTLVHTDQGWFVDRLDAT